MAAIKVRAAGFNIARGIFIVTCNAQVYVIIVEWAVDQRIIDNFKCLKQSGICTVVIIEGTQTIAVLPEPAQ
jgi:hypothetical protein